MGFNQQRSFSIHFLSGWFWSLCFLKPVEVIQFLLQSFHLIYMKYLNFQHLIMMNKTKTEAYSNLRKIILFQLVVDEVH